MQRKTPGLILTLRFLHYYDPEMPELILISDSDGEETHSTIVMNPIDNYLKRPNESPISEKSDEEWTKV